MGLTGKKNFVIRIDATMYATLEKWAADEFRSVNGQIEYLLYQAILQAGRQKRPKSLPGKGKGNGPKEK
jgi:hypothetical protein